MYTYWEASTALGFHTSPQMALSFTWVTSSLVVGQRGSTVIQYRRQSRLSVALHKLTVSVVLPCVSSFVLPSPFLPPSLPMEIHLSPLFLYSIPNLYGYISCRWLIEDLTVNIYI